MSTTQAFPPGELLDEERITRDLTIIHLAYLLEIDGAELDSIIRGFKPITPILAVKLEQVWEISADYWMGMQVAWDIQEARNTLNK